VADVETRRRRIVAGIHRHDLRREELRETCWIGAVSVQSALLELVEDQHVATLARASVAASARTRVSSSRGTMTRVAASARTFFARAKVCCGARRDQPSVGTCVGGDTMGDRAAAVLGRDRLRWYSARRCVSEARVAGSAA